jgi:hypothetical protein
MTLMTNTFPPFHSPDTAPVIYFDIAPTFGVMAGAVQIELATRVLVPVEDGNTRAEFVVTGRLRCSPAAIADLKQAIERSLEMLKQIQEQPAGSTPTAAAAGGSMH